MKHEKLQVKIPLILPEVPDEKDKCVDKLIKKLQSEDGLEKVHVANEKDNGVPQLCFHYDPEVISISRIQSLAEQTGAEITEKFGHKLIEVEGIRHTRHARTIERDIRNKEGIMEVSVSASGMVRIEFDKTKLNEADILKIIRKEGLDVPDSQVEAERIVSKMDKKGEAEEKQEGKKEHDHKEGESHDHAHGGLFGKNYELIFSIICGALLGIGFGLSFVEAVPAWVSLVLYIGAYFFGGFYTAKEAIQTVAKGGFEIDFLMLVAAIGAAILGEWAEGALLLFLFSMGHALEHFAMNKARKSIAALADLAPKTALCKKNGKTEEVGIEALVIGDIIVVKPNSKISADGVVVNGQSSVNQAPITGESVPVDKVPVDNPEKDWSQEDAIKDENRVFSGTINGNNTLEIKVIKEAK
ncbi:MAG: heavy metal translocating P-type ATPase, partial [Bacteroidetes bacterium]|nr:heavy metal translocating P-type ATPase [Bacteroidota bacterium]